MAIRLADTDGLANLSMSSLARELGCSKMALYRYIPGRSELVALMTNAAMGAPPAGHVRFASPQECRNRLDRLALELFRRYIAHPWMIAPISHARVPGPQELGWLESILEALGGIGVHPTRTRDVMALLDGQLRGLANQMIAAQNMDGSENNPVEQLTRALPAQTSQFPRAVAYLSAPEWGADREDALRFGVECVLNHLDLHPHPER
ncbi:TetR/AcrR family transcriptional regulator [Nocardia sp. NPDC101769]|uniref:TetR/AcrR family transcriptional regulator n=1 Tax=Nocardia sp. NPDC101769 TaxID=3364333 RepID=UPI00380AF5AC